MGVNSLPKTVTRQRRDCNLNPGPSAPESSTLIAKFHYTDPTGPARTRTDFFARPGPQTQVSDKVRGLCLVGSGRARVVEFSYNQSATEPPPLAVEFNN